MSQTAARALVIWLVSTMAGCGGARTTATTEESPRPFQSDGVLTVELPPTSTWGELREALLAADHEIGTPIRIAMGDTEITARTAHLTHEHFRREPFVHAIGLTQDGIVATTRLGYFPPGCNGTTYYEPEQRIAERGPDGYDMDALRTCLDFPNLGLGSVYIASVPDVRLSEIYAVIETAETMDPIIAFETPCWFENLSHCHEEAGNRDPLSELMDDRSEAFEACQVEAMQRGWRPERIVVHVSAFPTRFSSCEVSTPDTREQLEQQLASCVRQAACNFRHTLDYTAYLAYVLRSPDDPG